MERLEDDNVETKAEYLNHCTDELCDAEPIRDMMTELSWQIKRVADELVILNKRNTE